MTQLQLRFRSLCPALLVAVAVPVVAAAPSTTPTQGIRNKTVHHLAFTHATVVVSPNETIEDATLVVNDGRVVEIGPGLAVPKGALEVDLRGKRILPGFFDLVSEYGLGQAGPAHTERRSDAPQYTSAQNGAAAWNDAIHAERNWVDAFEPDAKAAEALLARGFTAVQSGKRDGIFRGRAFVASLATGLPNDVLLAPQALHFLSFDKGSSEQAYPSSLMGSIALLRQTFLDAEWYGKAQAVYAQNPLQPAPETNRALAALASYRGAFVFETNEDLSLLRAARIAEEAGKEFAFLGSGFEYERLEELAALGRPIILPLSFPKAPEVASYAASLDVTLADLRHWERSPSTAKWLADAGVRLAITGHGLRDDEDFWDNLRRAVRRGLPANAALAALTTVPAELAGLAGQLGTLEEGKRADFLVLSGDPFTAEVELLAAFVGGKLEKEWHPLDAVDFSGTHAFQLGGKALELALTREHGEYSGKLFRGKEEAELENLAASAKELTFTAYLGPGLTAQPARFTVSALGAAFFGRVSLADGSRQSFALSKAAKPRALDRDHGGHGEHGKGDDEAVDREPLLSRRTFPNAAFGFEALPRPESVLIKNATVWTNEAEGILEAADVLLEGGKIRAVGKGLTPPAGGRVIDATGKHVTAGIIDEHSHLAISEGVNEGSHAITAEVRIGDVVDPDDIGIYRALAGGVTAAQLLHGSANPIGGQAQIIKLRWGSSAEAMKLAGAAPTIKFALGENVKQSNWGLRNPTRYPQTRMGVEALMNDAFQAAREYTTRWAKYNALPLIERDHTVPPRRDLMLETLAEILEQRRFVHCHSYVASEILTLMRLAEEQGFRIQTFTHILDGYKVAPEMAAHGVGASSFSDWWAYKFEVYDAIPYNTCLLSDAGVVTSINSDSEELIRRLNLEAAKSVTYCGMPEAEALKLATLNPARQLKIDGQTGSLKAGKDADVVIWTGDPLSVYSRVEETWVDGIRMWSRAEDEHLRQRDHAERQALIEKVLRTGGGGGRGEHSFRKWQRDWDCEDVEDIWHARHDE